MKKFAAMAIAALLVIGSPAFSDIYAAEKWETEYEDLLSSHISGKKSSSFERFAVADINRDGIPEIFLQGKNDNDYYEIYTYEDGQLKIENSFYSAGFYNRVGENDLVVKFEDKNNIIFAVYEKNMDFNDYEKLHHVLLRARRVQVRGGYEWEYYYRSREVDEEQFEQYIDELFIDYGLLFRLIDENNISQYVNEGKNFYAKESNPVITVNKKTIGGLSGYAKIIFSDANEVLWQNAGETFLDGLIMVNGTFVSDAVVVNYGGNMLVPLRSIGQMLDADVKWNSDTNEITLQKDKKKIEITVGEDTAKVNGVTEKLMVPVMMIEGTTYVPVRFVSESFEMDTTFVPATESFPSVIVLEDRYYTDIYTYDAVDVLANLENTFNNVQWTERIATFSKSHMSSVLDYQLEDSIVYSRFISVILDTNQKVRVWTDMYTGQVFSVYDKGEEFIISSGLEAAVTFLQNEYL